MWTLSGFGALTMGVAGLSKFVQQTAWLSRFENWGYPAWFALCIGLVEVLGAALLLVPRVAIWAASGLICIMVGALFTVLTHPGPVVWAPAALQLVIMVAIVVLRYIRRPTF